MNLKINYLLTAKHRAINQTTHLSLPLRDMVAPFFSHPPTQISPSCTQLSTNAEEKVVTIQQKAQGIL